MDEKNMQTLREGDLLEVSGGAYNGPVFVYKLSDGDTLDSLASRYKTTTLILAELNHINNPLNPLTPGQTILIPSNW